MQISEKMNANTETDNTELSVLNNIVRPVMLICSESSLGPERFISRFTFSLILTEYLDWERKLGQHFIYLL